MKQFIIQSALAAACIVACAGQEIELSPKSKPHTLDATVGYKATAAEAKFDEKKSESPGSGDSKDGKKPTLAGHKDKLVSWFGIVRELPSKEGEPYLIENKYFDGLNDYHIQLASLSGAGDFMAIAADPKKQIERHSLVRIIGKVVEEKDGKPTVKAEYIRVWHLGDYTFMDYGDDASNPRWVKLRKSSGIDAYEPSPDKAYYERLLGE